MKHKYLIILLVIIISFAILAHEEDYDENFCLNSSIDLGISNSGLSFGNSISWNGIRFNIIGDGIEEISGINLSFLAA